MNNEAPKKWKKLMQDTQKGANCDTKWTRPVW